MRIVANLNSHPAEQSSDGGWRTFILHFIVSDVIGVCNGERHISLGKQAETRHEIACVRRHVPVRVCICMRTGGDAGGGALRRWLFP